MGFVCYLLVALPVYNSCVSSELEGLGSMGLGSMGLGCRGLQIVQGKLGNSSNILGVGTDIRRIWDM